MTSPRRRSGHAPNGRRARELGDPRDDLLGGEPARVERDRARGRPQRAVLARGVALVAQTLLGEHDRLLSAELVGASPRAHARVRGEEDLQAGVRRHDRADVAALGDPVAVGEQLALLGHERRAHAGIRGDARGRV